ncbi:MAG TPA: SMC-Scp complex subunit ScpB [Gammaproteobacteria bacterium]|jgi:segregation and condensation protein B|nr:SMC-Scp complex subunit ScpB [Gammaproteobacteria bacterium]
MKPEKKKELKNIVEGALLAAGRPLNVEEIQALFSDEERPDRAELKKALDTLEAEFADRGIELKEVASGYRIQVRRELTPWISRLWEERPARYSRALLETLALIAYRQPITRAEIEGVRGVTVSTHIMRTLQDRSWIRIVGHRDVPGHPEMFGTTREFLDYFSLKSLDELPTLSQLRDIESINAELDLGEFESMPAQAPVAAAPRLAEDESGAMDDGDAGVTTH